MKDKKNNEQPPSEVRYMPIGMCIGIGVGMAIGAAFGNIGVGMCLGLSIGMGAGMIVDSIQKKKIDDTADSDEEED